MNEILPNKDPQKENLTDLSIQSRRERSRPLDDNQLYKKVSFKISCVSSFLIHIFIFLWVFIFSAETESRFYGSGTAVSLIGADEIPGGSAKGKSGDIIPRGRKKSEPEKSSVKKTIPKRKSISPRKRIVKNKEKIRIIAPVKKKKVQKTKIKRKKKNTSKKKIQLQSEKRKRIRKRKKKRRRNKKKNLAGQKSYQDFLKRHRKKLKKEKKNRKKYEFVQRRKENKVMDGKSNKTKPKVGYRGDGGGDGQGGGSKRPMTGGIGNVDSALEKFYGTLTARISNFTEFPPIEGITSLKVTFAVDIYRNGKFRNLRIEKYSGNKTYDLSAKNAILRAFEPLVPEFPKTLKDKILKIGFRFCGRGICN